MTIIGRVGRGHTYGGGVTTKWHATAPIPRRVDLGAALKGSQNRGLTCSTSWYQNYGMAFIVECTAPSGEKYFGSAADSEGLRYRATRIEGAERFPSREAAGNALVELRQMRELSDYSFGIAEV
jgi:hypothetical protein